MIERLRSIFNQFQKKSRENGREAIPVKSRIESFPEFLKNTASQLKRLLQELNGI